MNHAANILQLRDMRNRFLCGARSAEDGTEKFCHAKNRVQAVFSNADAIILEQMCDVKMVFGGIPRQSGAPICSRMSEMERITASAQRKKRITRRRRPLLPPRVRRVIQRVRARIHAILPNGEVQSLVLYGSYVYGKPRPDSDVDLMLVYDDVTPEQEKALEELTIALYEERPRPHLFLYRADELAKHNGVSTLLYNVSHRGITLEGVPAPEHEINRERASSYLLAKAKQALVSAEAELNIQIYDASISRSFYAVLYASEAALATKGLVAKSHDGIEMLFGYHFFKKKLVDAQFKGLFKRIHNARIKADYKYDVEFTRDDAAYWFERAREFVAAIEAGLPQWLIE